MFTDLKIKVYKNSSQSIQKFIIANNEYSEGLDKSNILNAYFVNVGKNITDSVNTNDNDHLNSFYILPIMAHDVPSNIIFQKKKIR